MTVAPPVRTQGQALEPVEGGEGHDGIQEHPSALAEGRIRVVVVQV